MHGAPNSLPREPPLSHLMEFASLIVFYDFEGTDAEPHEGVVSTSGIYRQEKRPSLKKGVFTGAMVNHRYVPAGYARDHGTILRCYSLPAVRGKTARGAQKSYKPNRTNRTISNEKSRVVEADRSEGSVRIEQKRQRKARQQRPGRNRLNSMILLD